MNIHVYTFNLLAYDHLVFIASTPQNPLLNYPFFISLLHRAGSSACNAYVVYICSSDIRGVVGPLKAQGTVVWFKEMVKTMNH